MVHTVFSDQNIQVTYDPFGLIPNNDLQLLGQRYPTDKMGHGYLKIYQDFLEPRRTERLNFVELGVYWGASMMMWRDFFSHAMLVGVDIQFSNEMVAFFNNTRTNVDFFSADSADPHLSKSLENFFTANGRDGFDVVIDDASHLQYDMMKSLGNIYPSMNSGGIYIIEDMCTAEALNQGAKWWGSPDESVSADFLSLPGMERTSEFKKDWLPNGKKDTYYCAETTTQRFKETGVFDSAFLTKEENKYISENTDAIHFYKSGTGHLQDCGSSVAILIKK